MPKEGGAANVHNSLQQRSTGEVAAIAARELSTDSRDVRNAKSDRPRTLD